MRFYLRFGGFRLLRIMGKCRADTTAKGTKNRNPESGIGNKFLTTEREIFNGEIYGPVI